jgi:glycosyltransferase involved in cell wall biosynthesis
MRVLWISDSPDTPSGFGNVTRFVCDGLARRGHSVSILGWQTLEAHDWRGCKVYQAAGTLGSRALFPFLVRHRPEIVIALGDVWWMPYFSAPHVRRQMELGDTPWSLYFPIDGETTDGRLPASWIDLLRDVDIPIAMSDYGQRVVKHCGLTCDYIPHGVDLDVFCPPLDREEAKARIGCQGNFLVLSDSRNQPRKMLPRLLDVFAKFVAHRPDARLHLHTDPADEFTRSGIYSYDVRADLRHLGIESKVSFTPGMVMKSGRGVSLDELATYYQAADVHILASTGEGFGLPTLQAAAAGAVPMAGDYSASRELVNGHGMAIDIAEWSENEFGIQRGLIDVDDAVRKLVTFYDNRDLLREHSVRSRQFATAYGWNKIVDQWDKLLRSVGGRTRRITRVTQSRPLPDKLLSQIVPQFDGASVKVNVVERQFGRLEAGIVADAKGHISDVRIPAVQEACQVSGLRVLRSPSYLGVAPADQKIFLELKSIFPVLGGWVPGFSGVAVTELEASADESLRLVRLRSSEEGRYVLAQSVLLLNVSGEFSESTLIDAALYGVPCIGTQRCDAQLALWPELTTENVVDAVRLARRLLTNAAQLRRLAAQGRVNCQLCYAPDEEDAAAWLRLLHLRESPAPAARKEPAHGDADVHGCVQRGVFAAAVPQRATPRAPIRGLHLDGDANRSDRGAR